MTCSALKFLRNFAVFDGGIGGELVTWVPSAWAVTSGGGGMGQTFQFAIDPEHQTENAAEQGGDGHGVENRDIGPDADGEGVGVGPWFVQGSVGFGKSRLEGESGGGRWGVWIGHGVGGRNGGKTWYPFTEAAGLPGVFLGRWRRYGV